MTQSTERAGGGGRAATDGAGEGVESTLPGTDGGHVVTTWLVDGCGEPLELSPGEARMLASMLDGLEPVEPVVFCGLDAEHPGPHLALGQVSESYWWWLRWDDTGVHRELVERAPCYAITDDPAAGNVGVACTLPQAHPGSHSYVRPA